MEVEHRIDRLYRNRGIPKVLIFIATELILETQKEIKDAIRLRVQQVTTPKHLHASLQTTFIGYKRNYS